MSQTLNEHMLPVRGDGRLNMKVQQMNLIKFAVVAAATTASVAALAQTSAHVPPPPGNGEYGRVISSTAIQTAVNTPRQVCGVEQVAVPVQKSGGGAVLGAVAGGAIGNTMGHGSGRAVATMIGIVGGAMVGDRIEGGGGTQVQNVERCTTQNVVEYRVTGYNVVYEYAGRQYSVQLPYEPGPWIRLQVSPVAQQPQSLAPAYVAPVATTTVVQPAVVYQPMVMPAMTFGVTYVSGHRHHHRHHVQPTVGVGLNYGAGYPRSWY